MQPITAHPVPLPPTGLASTGAAGPTGSQATSASARDESKDAGSDPALQAQLRVLHTSDRLVRAHEQAHLAAGASVVTSGPHYSFQLGPDGRLYAVAGSVSIDASPIAGDPAATLAKAEQIIAAALAPAQPSSQDRAVAAQAARMAQQARIELALASRPDGYDPQGRRQRDPRGVLVDTAA